MASVKEWRIPTDARCWHADVQREEQDCPTKKWFYPLCRDLDSGMASFVLSFSEVKAFFVLFHAASIAARIEQDG